MICESESKEARFTVTFKPEHTSGTATVGLNVAGAVYHGMYDQDHNLRFMLRELHPEFYGKYFDSNADLDFEEIEKVVFGMVDKLEYTSAKKAKKEEIVQIPLGMREFDVKDPDQKFQQEDMLQDMTITVQKNF